MTTPAVRMMLALPSYRPDGLVVPAVLAARAEHPEWAWYLHFQTAPILTYAFNDAWAQMLTLREQGIVTHFCLLHADVVPQQRDWLGTLLRIMAERHADVVAAIIPIKDARGLTSTALDTDPWHPVRLTQAQIHNELPETWTAKDLLFNTGLMLVDVREDWVTEVCFQISDRIVRDPTGAWRAECQPEDWTFSRRLRALDRRAVVTRAVPVHHYGASYWASEGVWGDPTDRAHMPATGFHAEIEE